MNVVEEGLADTVTAALAVMAEVGKPAIKLAVLVSGRGSNLQAIINNIEKGKLNAEIVLVLSDNPNAYALKIAKDHFIAAEVLTYQKGDGRSKYGIALAEKVAASGAELVVLAGFMRILPSSFLEMFPQKVINIHPALLPSFPGLHAQEQAFVYGVKVSGCTVHFVDTGVDTGQIIAQRAVDISGCKDADEVADAILVEEHKLYSEVLSYFAAGWVKLENGRVIIKK